MGRNGKLTKLNPSPRVLGELAAREHEPIDCVHYGLCLAQIARIKHGRLKAVPCEGCRQYAPEGPPERPGGWQRGDWTPEPGP